MTTAFTINDLIDLRTRIERIEARLGRQPAQDEFERVIDKLLRNAGLHIRRDHSARGIELVLVDRDRNELAKAMLIDRGAK